MVVSRKTALARRIAKAPRRVIAPRIRKPLKILISKPVSIVPSTLRPRLPIRRVAISPVTPLGVRRKVVVQRAKKVKRVRVALRKRKVKKKLKRFKRRK